MRLAPLRTKGAVNKAPRAGAEIPTSHCAVPTVVGNNATKRFSGDALQVNAVSSPDQASAGKLSGRADSRMTARHFRQPDEGDWEIPWRNATPDSS